MKLERQVVMFCFVIKSAIVNSPVFSLVRQIIGLSLSILSLMFYPAKVQPRTKYEKPISLLDLDDAYSSSITSTSASTSLLVSPEVDNPLKDLLKYDGGLIYPVSSNQVVKQERVRENTDPSPAKGNNIDDMILANLANFNEQVTFNLHEPLECTSGLVKRK